LPGFSSGKAYERSGKFASQSIEHVRAVASLGRLNAFVADYGRTLEYPTSITKRTAQIQGLTFGFTESAYGCVWCVCSPVEHAYPHWNLPLVWVNSIFGIWALSFWYGARVVDDGYCSFAEMFKSQCE
jgi:hypothetical protein